MQYKNGSSMYRIEVAKYNQYIRIVNYKNGTYRNVSLKRYNRKGDMHEKYQNFV